MSQSFSTLSNYSIALFQSVHSTDPCMSKYDSQNVENHDITNSRHDTMRPCDSTL